MDISDIKGNIDELKSLLSQSKRPVIRDLLEAEIKRQNGILSTIAKPKPVVAAAKGLPTKKINNYAWDETNKAVKIFITGIKEAGQQIEKVEPTFDSRSVSVMLRGVAGKNHTLTIGNLKGTINVEESSIKTTKTGATITLMKSSPGNWGSLKASKDDKVDEGPKVDKDADPNAGMMSLMKQMYETGDDNMKQMINKTMYESQQKQRNGEGSGLPDMGDLGAGLDSL